MPEKQFYESKILYELFRKSGNAIEKDTIEQIAPLLGFSTNPEDLAARLDRLMRGLPPEDEFMALAIWMEKCRLIHKLDEEQYPLSSTDKYQVPDLFAIFEHDGEQLPVFIEVKTSAKKTRNLPKLRFTERLYTKLSNYSTLTGIPILIAWKVYGHWTLFDMKEMQIKKSAYHIGWSDAMKMDLMYTLLDNILIVPKADVTLTILLEDLGMVEKTSESEERHKVIIKSLQFADADGNPIKKLSWTELVLWIFSTQEEEQKTINNEVHISFRVVQEPNMLPAYTLLPLILFQLRSVEKRPKNWHDVIQKNDIGPIRYSKLKQTINKSMGIFVHAAMQLVPHRYPDFLKLP